jgi:N-acetylglucosaminyl-diphospho-decaprenol L-rhamnosyltransferase
VIVNWNTRDYLRRCLAAIDRAPPPFPYETVVVDNGSTDGSVALVAADFPGVRVIANPANRGFAAANNQGIRASTGRYVLLLNSDAEVAAAALERTVAFLDDHPNAAVVGGKLVNPDGSFQWSYADFPTLPGELCLLTGLSRWLLPKGYPSYPEHRSRTARSVDWVLGAFMVVRRAAIDTVGALDEDYFMYTEETDWCYRLKRQGWQIWYLPQVMAVHQAGGSARRVPERKRAQLYQSKWLFLRKHRGGALAALYRGLVRVVSGAKLAGWWLIERLGSGPRRNWARQNVVAYRFLLSNF